MERIKGRLAWTVTILVFFFVLAALRIGYIQLVHTEYYVREALSKETEGVSLEEYTRGDVLDRNGQSLTGAYSANRIVIFPALLENPDAAAKGLAAILGADLPMVQKMLTVKKPSILPFPLTSSQLELIQNLGLKGLQVVPYRFRYGPNPLAVHMVGHLGRIRDVREMEEFNRTGEKTYRLSDWVGRQGLEYFYEGSLKGTYPAGFAGFYTDAVGNALPGKSVLVDTKLGDFTRSDVITTIDGTIQEKVERIMDKTIKKGVVVVMDRLTGDILAVASRPAYNPDFKKTSQGEDHFVNQAISLFQPGSVFKVVVAAAALSEGYVKADTGFFCRGFEAKPVRCWKEDGHGSLTFSEAFAQSCNPAFVKIGLDLGSQKIIQYAHALGLDNQTILGFPVTEDKRQNLNLIAGPYNLVNSSVGQGPVLATPIQITAMINTIANEGVYMKPRLVKEVRPNRGEPTLIEGSHGTTVLKPEIARQLSDLMTLVTKEGVGQKAWVVSGGSAGKTGSAQLGDGVDGVNAWFSGYGPLDNAKYTVTVLVREGISGGETAAPVFRDILTALLENKSINNGL